MTPERRDDPFDETQTMSSGRAFLMALGIAAFVLALIVLTSWAEWFVLWLGR